MREDAVLDPSAWARTLSMPHLLHTTQAEYDPLALNGLSYLPIRSFQPFKRVVGMICHRPARSDISQGPPLVHMSERCTELHRQLSPAPLSDVSQACLLTAKQTRALTSPTELLERSACTFLKGLLQNPPSGYI